jgi:DNA-binding CsgD family transcriptional regulator
MTFASIPQAASSDIAEALEAAESLRELGAELARFGSRVLGASGVCFFPFAGAVSSTADATFFHEQHDVEHMRAETLAFIPVQEREFARGDASALDRIFQVNRRVVDLNEMLGPEGLERKASFNEYWRPCHIERQLFVPLGDQQARVGYIAASRSAREAPFRELERERLEWLSAHALTALWRLTSRGPLSANEVLLALKAIPLSCAVFNAAGALVWLSASAASELGLRRVGTHIAEVVEHNRALLEWQAAAHGALASGGVDSRAGALSLRRLETSSGPLLLVISASPRVEPPGAGNLPRLWQLTTRESEVLAELVAGRSNKEIAARLAVSARTVDVHVSAVLRKARCSSRAELIARVLGGK